MNDTGHKPIIAERDSPTITRVPSKKETDGLITNAIRTRTEQFKVSQKQLVLGLLRTLYMGT